MLNVPHCSNKYANFGSKSSSIKMQIGRLQPINTKSWHVSNSVAHLKVKIESDNEDWMETCDLRSPFLPCKVFFSVEIFIRIFIEIYFTEIFRAMRQLKHFYSAQKISEIQYGILLHWKVYFPHVERKNYTNSFII